jgi:hypothetical protein
VVVDIRVGEQFEGRPTINDMEHVIDEVEGAVEVRWTNTRQELALLDKFIDRDFILFVKDASALEKTTISLGKVIQVKEHVLEAGITALNHRKQYNWRGFTYEVGANTSRAVLAKMSADSIRDGGCPRLADVAKRCLLEGINPIDADVLLRLEVVR